MRRFCFFTVIFLMGVFFAAAQDLIILRDGSMIEAKVSEISLTEIRYKRFDNLDGPTIVISSDRVLSIRYQNGTQEIINADTKSVQKSTQAEPTTTALNPDKFIFAFNTNPGGLILLGYGGPSVCLEFGKGGFNSEVNLIIPSMLFMGGGGFGGLATFNWFKHTSTGGFYLGGGIGYILVSFPKEEKSEQVIYDDLHILTVGLNVGYKFVTKSGIYFRTGSYLGIATGLGYYIKPDLSIGYCFK